MGDIWSVGKGHKREAEWLKDLNNELGNDKHLQESFAISVENVTKQCRKMPAWNVPEKDGFQGYWIKNLSNLHERIAIQTNKILMGDGSSSVWITHGPTVICQKDPRKDYKVENYHPIACLPLVWKFLTGVIGQKVYGYLKVLPEEQKGCRRGKRGTKDNCLLIRLQEKTHQFIYGLDRLQEIV